MRRRDIPQDIPLTGARDLKYNAGDGQSDQPGTKQNGDAGPLSRYERVAEANGDDPEAEDAEENAEEGEPSSGWWDAEDPSAQWMTQATRLMPNTMITLWQFTP